ncbi:MAG: hypothetical protein K5839_01180 [Treponemataceae bacterium]|nr:hypothetical protein [Treponemataceae bacterium]
MKKIRIITAVFAALSLSMLSSFAQDVVEVEDLSTTIKKENFQLEEEAKPEFVEEELPQEAKLPSLDSELPELEDESKVSKSEKDKEELLYFEGNIAGGYPGIFNGDFALSRSAKNNYFSFDFFHDSASGYALEKAYDGFYNSNTGLEVDGNAFFNDKFNFEYAGNYQAFQFGLQGISPKFYSTHLQTGNLYGKFDFDANENINLFMDMDADLSSWYASFLSTSENQQANSQTRFGLSPRFGFKANAGIFDCLFDGQYDFQMASGLTPYYDHRIEFDYKMRLSFDNILLNGAIAYVYSENKSIVPFEVELSYTGRVDLSLSGGLKSQQAEIYEIEKENSLVYSDYQVQEQSDWFANFFFRFPIGKLVENSLKAEFAMTAFDNGMLVVNYSEIDADTGLYKVENFSATRFNTEYEFYVNFKNSLLSILWQAWWLDCPDSENPQSVALEYSYAGENDLWGLSSYAKIGFGGDREILGDIIPDVGASAYIRAGKSFKFSLILDDCVKLFSARQRTLYGSYIQDSGSVSLLVSFYL